MKNQYYDAENQKQTETKKFRLVIDKTGIKRVEEL